MSRSWACRTVHREHNIWFRSPGAQSLFDEDWTATCDRGQHASLRAHDGCAQLDQMEDADGRSVACCGMRCVQTTTAQRTKVQERARTSSAAANCVPQSINQTTESHKPSNRSVDFGLRERTTIMTRYSCARVKRSTRSEMKTKNLICVFLPRRCPHWRIRATGEDAYKTVTLWAYHRSIL